TLAKWYEAVVLAPQPEALPLTVRLGINGALASATCCTLAKWYEAVVLAPQPEALPLTVRLGINGALASA
ncbi:hypothetical protein G7L32_26940, partial [Klebsiella quasipneumoniae]|nr:hypothetical protein [Klebsiella quasipneumoniae]